VSVTVITPTIPERAEQLAEAIESVQAQSRPPEAHLIEVDDLRQGTAAMRNRMVEEADTEWVAPLDDDDLLLPIHLQVLLDGASSSGADVIYSDWNGHVPKGCPRDFDSAALRAKNFIPATALIRREAIEAVGGYPEVHGEDWALWLLMDRAGARFYRVPVVTWTYRRGTGGKQATRPKGARQEALRAVGLA